MTTHIATRAFELTDSLHCFAYGDARYHFTVTPGRKAVTWANASGGFSPAENPTVDVTKIEYRLHHKHDWSVADGIFGDLLSEVSDAWFLDAIAEEGAA